MKTARTFAHMTVLLVIGFGVETVVANDWPSWRGHAQNGVSNDTNLPSTWSVDGENLIWSDAWIGRSTPAVFDGRVCANGRTGNGVTEKEVVACWDAENGNSVRVH